MSIPVTPQPSAVNEGLSTVRDQRQFDALQHLIGTIPRVEWALGRAAASKRFIFALARNQKPPPLDAATIEALRRDLDRISVGPRQRGGYRPAR